MDPHNSEFYSESIEESNASELDAEYSPETVAEDCPEKEKSAE
jgi:hypothetical protein